MKPHFQKISRILDLPGRIPQEALLRYVRTFQEKADVYLRLAEKWGSPFFVIDENSFHTRTRRFVDAFSSRFQEFKAYLAVKCNNHPAIAGMAVEIGLGLDVSSGTELQTALNSGCRDILFSGPGKADEELDLAADHCSMVTVLLDSRGELHRLNSIAGEKKCTMTCGVRLSTDEKGMWRKFGIGISELPGFMSDAEACHQVRISGIHFHTSWNRSPAAQIRFIVRLGEQLRQMDPRHLDRLKFIDVGGGYWPEKGEWLQPGALPWPRFFRAIDAVAGKQAVHYRLVSEPIEAYAEKLSNAMEEQIFPYLTCSVKAEPGRWLCDEAMHILLTVVDKKSPDVVITDGGINMVGWERYETDFAPVINLSRPAEKEKKCNIFGSLCTPRDIWGTGYYGADIACGDVLLVPGQGAYTYSLRQAFIKPLPKVVSLSGQWA